MLYQYNKSTCFITCYQFLFYDTHLKIYYICNDSRKNNELPKFDLPIDFVVTDEITGELLNQYGRFPCKIKAGLFIFCTKGYVKAKINFNDCEVKENTFITLLPNSFIQVKSVSNDVHLYVVGFSGTFISKNDYQFKSIFGLTSIFIIRNPVLPLPSKAQVAIEHLYEHLLNLCFLYDISENRNTIHAVFTIFLETTAQLYKKLYSEKEKEVSREDELYRKFIFLLMENYTKEHNVFFYAEKCDVTLQYFCTAIKKASKHTPFEIIASFLIMNAKDLLKTTSSSIKEISDQLGFINQSYFNRFFKRHV